MTVARKSRLKPHLANHQPTPLYGVRRRYRLACGRKITRRTWWVHYTVRGMIDEDEDELCRDCARWAGGGR